MEIETSKIVPSKKIRFCKSYISRQNWAFPDSVIYYISKNPSTSDVYQELIQSCKYFFIKNPILIIPKFSNLYGEGVTWLNEKSENDKNINNIFAKFWITQKLFLYSKNVNEFVPKIYKCDIQKLTLTIQTIFCEELLFLSSNVEHVSFHEATVKSQNGSILPVEKLVELLPKLTYFECGFRQQMPNITFETFKGLLKIPPFLKLLNFHLYYIPETFDLGSFYAFMKKNNRTRFSLDFANDISDAYQNRLQKMKLFKKKIGIINCLFLLFLELIG